MHCNLIYSKIDILMQVHKSEKSSINVFHLIFPLSVLFEVKPLLSEVHFKVTCKHLTWSDLEWLFSNNKSSLWNEASK